MAIIILSKSNFFQSHYPLITDAGLLATTKQSIFMPLVDHPCIKL